MAKGNEHFGQITTKVNTKYMRVQVYRAIDMGFTNPTAVLWIGVTEDEDWVVFQELYETGQTTDYYTGRINSMSQGMNIVATYGDPSAAQLIADYATRGIYITPANKAVGTAFPNWVRFGIDRVSEKLKQKPGKNRIDGKKDEKGAPSLYVYSTCTNFIREMETYRWHEKSVSKAQDLNEPDVPEKANDHICDALRYFAVSYSPISKTDQQRYGKDYEFINVDEKKDIWRIGK